MDDELRAWIQEARAARVSEDQIRQSLVDRGYSLNAIRLVLGERAQQQVEAQRRMDADPVPVPRTVKEFFSPTPAKLVVPLLIFLLALGAFFAYQAHFPALGSWACAFLGKTEQAQAAQQDIRLAQLREGMDGKGMIVLLQKRDAAVVGLTSAFDIFKEDTGDHAVALFQETAVFEYAQLYRLDPWFPEACEDFVGSDFGQPLKSCRTYITAQDASCIQQRTAGMAGVGSLFTWVSQPYRPASFPLYLLHSVILAAVIFVIICALTWLNRTAMHLDEMRKKLFNWSLMVGNALLWLALAYYDSPYQVHALVLLPFTMLFILFTMEHTPHVRKLTVSTAAVLAIMALLAAMVVIDYEIRSSQAAMTPFVMPEIAYSVQSCGSGVTLSNDEKIQASVPIEMRNQTWRVCDKDLCSATCETACSGDTPIMASHTPLRGAEPGCICGCAAQNPGVPNAK